MNVHEYQGKEILKKYGVPVPAGRVATTPAEAEAIAKELGGGTVVVKAQIHAGGRGKGGGVMIAKNPAEAKAAAEKILGMQLVTHQTGPGGKEVHRVLVEAGCNIARELYLGVTMDRATEKIVVMACAEGGVEIEEIAARTPEKILKVFVDPLLGMQPFQARQLAFGLGLGKDLVKKAVPAILALYRAFVENDGSMAEINPLVITKEGDVLALDAKMNFDGNALYRHPAVAAMRDESEEDPQELEASKHDLSYVSLDGNIGCMVNGAGLAMATMDLIKQQGGEPANFLDVGGGADQARVATAFKLILADKNVRAILVNIFGGILRCDIIAGGIVAAAREVNLALPLVVRLRGTNEEEGRQILAESGLQIMAASGMADAAEKVVQSVQ
ncbi:MAG: ADP-forming succinate--CoA ligase subunit beta [Deltaproteobacteria bacterium]|nr:ADP-forming succinate--CoA ligase subunit beta [Deltaproteobacteria bacterium]